MNNPAPLAARLKREADYHDTKYAGGRTPRHYLVGPTQYIYERMRESLGDLRDREVLECGCGEGWITCDLAQRGARVTAFDISPQAVHNTRSALAAAQLLDRCSVDVMPAEHLTYPAESFDVAVGFAIIHHLDVPRALAELHRVLKPGGIACFAEPLATNPLIRAYRKLTPQFRTVDERPLVLSELAGLLAQFRSFRHREFYLTALGAIALTYVPGGARHFPSVSAALHRVDQGVLSVFPGLGKWAWYSLIHVTR